MVYAMISAAALLAISIARIIFLNSEIKTLDAAGVKFHALIGPWEAENPIDYTTPETYAASKEKMPKDLQDAETEYAWLSNERDSKKESRTIWYGCAILFLAVTVITLILLVGESR